MSKKTFEEEHLDHICAKLQITDLREREILSEIIDDVNREFPQIGFVQDSLLKEWLKARKGKYEQKESKEA